MLYAIQTKKYGDITDELIDRFGNLPQETMNLIEIAKIKILCRKVGITKISQKLSGIVFNFSAQNFKMEWIDKLLKTFRNKIKFSPATEPYITYKIENSGKILEEIKKLIEELQ